MVIFKRRHKRSYTFLPQKKRFCIALAAFALVFAVALFGLISRSNALNRLEQTRDALAGAIQDNMNQVLNSFESMSRKSNSDIVEEVLPSMEQYMYTASTLNAVLTDSFGEKYSVLSHDLYADFEAVVQEYANQIAMGQSTSAAAENMTTCMNDIEQTLTDRFSEDGLINPRTALK